MIRAGRVPTVLSGAREHDEGAIGAPVIVNTKATDSRLPKYR